MKWMLFLLLLFIHSLFVTSIVNGSRTKSPLHFSLTCDSIKKKLTVFLFHLIFLVVVCPPCTYTLFYFRIRAIHFVVWVFLYYEFHLLVQKKKKDFFFVLDHVCFVDTISLASWRHSNGNPRKNTLRFFQLWVLISSGNESKLIDWMYPSLRFFSNGNSWLLRPFKFAYIFFCFCLRISSQQLSVVNAIYKVNILIEVEKALFASGKKELKSIKEYVQMQFQRN